MLFGVYGEVRSKKDLTESALFEMYGNRVNQAVANKTRQHLFVVPVGHPSEALLLDGFVTRW
jgi:hypothetical protein